jgi:hypothetical protein
MRREQGQNRRLPLIAALLLCVPAATAGLRDGPVAAMFAADQKRHEALASSFVVAELPATGTAAAPARVFLSAGDLARAFDEPAFRPDAAVVPTNTELLIDAAEPGTQRVLIDRVRKHPDVLRDLEAQLAARRQTSPGTTGTAGTLQIALDTLVVSLPRSGERKADAAFPKAACLIPTDFAKGGAIEQRELYAQSRVRKGIAACLAALDAAGATSVVLPLVGAASSESQERDAVEGQRVLKECRLINATAGIALGVRDFAASRRNVREIGLVQWDEEVAGMFRVPKGSRAESTAKRAYAQYAEQVAQAFRKGLAGEPTTASDVHGSCIGVLNVQ